MTVESSEHERPPRGRRILRDVGTAAGLAVAAVIAFNPGNVLSRLPGSEEKVAKAAKSAAHDRASATVAHPFAGSPAEQYADGSAGIVVPQATAISTLTKEQVAEALETTKKFLVAANLDPAVIRGERPETAIGLVEPHQKNTLADMSASLASPDQKHNPLQFFSRFDPNEVRLAGGTVKTHGRMTFEAGSKKGSVLIHSDFTFVYPVTKAPKAPKTPKSANASAKPPKPSAEVARTVVRRVIDTEVFDPDHYTVAPGTVDLHSVQMNVGNTRCGVYDGYLHPHFRSEHRSAADKPSGEAIDPYDQSRQLPDSRQCNRTTRT
ncbi:hypothetical protein LKL35_28390 [Streptomyces sp. ET3-23]|uniref:hypothetical protein n=1 Tax=Streptomyces sp. ET3-23 TaxID=2885643 RepID=UPI001D11C37B|nr:hypothetical protein [Streptomyces sp. ET3-23]MCC2279321.1 hypothetical protein [Streptomyces sp. ET3-23]